MLVWLVYVLVFVSLGLSCMGLFVLLGLDWLFPFPCWGNFQNFQFYNLLKDFLITFLFLFFSGTPVIRVLVHLTLPWKSLRLSSALFILFTLFCCLAAISTILSSGSLIHSSASDNPLLIPSRVLLISVTVLFVSNCLYFTSSRFFVNLFLHFLHSIFEILDHHYYHYYEFFSR